MNKLAVAIGIDPGVKGAIAYRTSGGYYDVVDMPQTVRDIWRYLEKATDGANTNRMFCCIESQRHWGKSDDLQGNRLTRYLKHYGALTAILELLAIKYEEVPAKTWQADLLGFIDEGQTKLASVDYATRNAPSLKDKLKAKTTGRPDAMCLALYAEQSAKFLTERGR